LFLAEDDVPGRGGTAVLGHALWSRRFGADPAVVGRSLTLNGVGYEIVGVLPREFTLPREVLPTLGVAEDGELFVPLPLASDAANVRGREDYNILGKLKRGVTQAEAQAEMETITARLRQEHPEVYPPNGGLTFGIVPLHEQVVGNVRFTLLLLMGAVALVLLVACSNVANLLVARALGRQKEIAVRLALGASRGRVARQLLTESVLLSLAGGAAGVPLAWAAVRWVHLAQPAIPRLRAVAIDWQVLAFTLAVSVASGLVFGLLPAFAAPRVDVRGALAAGGRAGTSGGALWARGHRLRAVLVAAELALSVVLLIGAGLLVRSFAALQQVAPGFDPSGVLTLEVAVTAPRYPDAAAVADLYKRLWERLDRLSRHRAPSAKGVPPPKALIFDA
jgi:predicted permease